MKINKYTPPDSLKAKVMSKITDDGYADELLSLPETSQKKSRVIPLLSAAAIFTLVVCASVYVIGLDGHNRSKTDDEASTGCTNDDFNAYDDTMIGIDGSTNPSEDGFDADSPPTSDDFVIQDFVSNDNAFTPEEESRFDTDENGSSKGDSAPATVTVNGNTFTLSADDSKKIKQLLDTGMGIELDCIKCSARYEIQIGKICYTVHNECGNIQCGHSILSGVSIPALDDIVKKYIDIE